jgi:hypothetical protein
MYVEFIGVPGAGKTTIAKEVCILLEKSGAPCTTRMNFFGPQEKKSHKSRWSLIHLSYLDPYALLLWLRLAYRRKMGLEKTATRVHEYQKLRYQLAHMKKKSISVWDSGFVQWFSNHVLAGLLTVEAATNFIDGKLPSNSLLVFINTPVEESVRRMYEREVRLRATTGVKWTPNVGEVQKRQEDFARGEHTQRILFDGLAKCGVSTLVLDGSMPPKENARILSERLQVEMPRT